MAGGSIPKSIPKSKPKEVETTKKKVVIKNNKPIKDNDKGKDKGKSGSTIIAKKITKPIEVKKKKKAPMIIVDPDTESESEPEPEPVQVPEPDDFDDDKTETNIDIDIDDDELMDPDNDVDAPEPDNDVLDIDYNKINKDITNSINQLISDDQQLMDNHDIPVVPSSPDPVSSNNPSQSSGLGSGRGRGRGRPSGPGRGKGRANGMYGYLAASKDSKPDVQKAGSSRSSSSSSVSYGTDMHEQNAKMSDFKNEIEMKRQALQSVHMTQIMKKMRIDVQIVDIEHELEKKRMESQNMTNYIGMIEKTLEKLKKIN